VVVVVVVVAAAAAAAVVCVCVCVIKKPQQWGDLSLRSAVAPQKKKQVHFHTHEMWRYFSIHATK
jgi:hypothetical protein